MPTTYWYCCNCGAGGYNANLVGCCLDCGYSRCEGCSSELLADSDSLLGEGLGHRSFTIPAAGSFLSLGPALDRGPLVTPFATSCGNAFAASGTTPKSCPQDSGSRYNVAAGLAFTDLMFPPGDGSFKSTATGGDKKAVDYVWFCCACANGPWNVKLYSACIFCHHPRGQDPCCRCTVETIVRKST